jgi:hypothetical protein
MLDILPPSPPPTTNTHNASLWHPPAAPAPAPVPSSSSGSGSTRLRARATLKDSAGRPQAVGKEEEEAEDERRTARQVDFYVGRTRRDAEAEGGGEGGKGQEETSYMFCPQAFGMMAPGLSSAYWRHVEAFLALPEAEQRAAKRRLLLQQQEEQQQQQQQQQGDEEGGRERRAGNRTTTATTATATAPVSGREGEGEDPRLLLLVPARSVDWGAGGQEQTQKEYHQHRHQQGEGLEEAWLEVGCRLTSMRLVNDVRFPAAAATSASSSSSPV